MRGMLHVQLPAVTLIVLSASELDPLRRGISMIFRLRATLVLGTTFLTVLLLTRIWLPVRVARLYASSTSHLSLRNLLLHSVSTNPRALTDGLILRDSHPDRFVWIFAVGYLFLNKAANTVQVTSCWGFDFSWPDSVGVCWRSWPDSVGVCWRS